MPTTIEAIARAAYAEHMTSRPILSVFNCEMSDAEIEAIWAFKERRDFILDINQELTSNEHLSRVAAYLCAHLAFVDDYYAYLWAAYRSQKFEMSRTALIRCASYEWYWIKLWETAPACASMKTSQQMSCDEQLPAETKEE